MKLCLTIYVDNVYKLSLTFSFAVCLCRRESTKDGSICSVHAE